MEGGRGDGAEEREGGGKGEGGEDAVRAREQRIWRRSPICSAPRVRVVWKRSVEIGVRKGEKKEERGKEKRKEKKKTLEF